MSDARILTVAIAITVPVSTLLAGTFIQDRRATALRAEMVDALKQFREEMADLRDEMQGFRSGLREIRTRLAT
jgi:hypothetical protein